MAHDAPLSPRETRQGPAVAQPVRRGPPYDVEQPYAVVIARKCPRCADGAHEGACAQPFKREVRRG